ncbi:ribonuclease [Paraburkholderia phymatum]|uniref:Ribonuclease n=2 Tax=Paraburkholderia TaxID=1822464 RepID=A0A7X1TE63_9BURK|nr:ribonuclease [Paraburkholderia franconis]MPW15912.1 ribonuclease [Paraburkholderia franconis]
MARKWLRDGVLIAALTVGGLVGSSYQTGAFAREAQQAQAGGTIALAQLPPEAVRTLNSIAAGGPYPYEKDGVVFGNRERLLPPHRRGYYHEYTVPTPHARDRGARRIVCGGPLRRTDNCYYSDDHYASFNRIID